MKYIIFALLIATMPGYLESSYKKTINGKVTDTSGKAVLATITVKGTSVSTTTDTSGYFSLTIPDDAKILVVSAVGFNSKEVRIQKNSKSLSIMLFNTAVNLEEVVVTGYGVQKQLQGQAAGVVVRGNRSEAATRKNNYQNQNYPQTH